VNENQETRFLFLSQLLRRGVRDSEGNFIGRIHDLSALVGEIYPIIHTVLIRCGRLRRYFLVAQWKDVSIPNQPNLTEVALKVPRSSLVPTPVPLDNEFFLRKELLDNQIVDTRGRKVIRVNDVSLMLTNDEMRVVHVDVGMRGFFRSLGWGRLVDWIVKFFFPRARYFTRDHFISWKFVQPVSVGSLKRGLLKLSVTIKKISRLHPADLAEIMQDLDSNQRSALFQSFDLETAAGTLGESGPKLQRSLLETVGAEKAAHILEEMPRDKAADLLADLPEEEASEILTKMDQKKAREVSELLSYAEDSAGGLMTTEFISTAGDILVKDMMEKMRGELSTAETIHYIFVIGEGGILRGVITLKNLLLARPEQRIDEIMSEEPVSIHPEETVTRMIELFTKYKLHTLPVVDSEGRIKGIVTMDDIIAFAYGKKEST